MFQKDFLVLIYLLHLSFILPFQPHPIVRFQRKLFATTRGNTPTSSTTASTTPTSATKNKTIPPPATIDDFTKLLKGWRLECAINGFQVDEDPPFEDLQAVVTLTAEKSTLFSYGLMSVYPGIWRIIDSSSSSSSSSSPSDITSSTSSTSTTNEINNKNLILEFTQPTPGLYSFVFGLADRDLVWRSTIDWSSKKVINGEIVARKKRFFLFPYTEVIATFTAKLVAPDEKISLEDVPSALDYNWEVPEDFNSPIDMLKYPDRFDPQFARWYLDCLEATDKGQPLPKRPKKFFRPPKPVISSSSSKNKSEDNGDEEGNADDDDYEDRVKRGFSS